MVGAIRSERWAASDRYRRAAHVRIRSVELRGFGAFTVKQRNARIGRNPRTRETVQVGENAVPYFKTGKELRGQLNRGGVKRRT